MTIGAEIDSIRKNLGLSVVDMCNIFNVKESEYFLIVRGQYKLSVFQLIMFVSSVCKPLNSVLK